MTFDELHEILDNEDRKLSKAELEEVIYQLKQDALNEFMRVPETTHKNLQNLRKIGFYDGEQNAFQIVLDLLEHLEDKEIKQ